MSAGHQLTVLPDLIRRIDAEGWRGHAAVELRDLLRAQCRIEASRWALAAGDVGDLTAAVWEALRGWMEGPRHVNPVAVMRVTLRRLYAAEALSVQLCAGDTVNRRRHTAGIAARPLRASVDVLDALTVDVDLTVAPPAQWVVVLTGMLTDAGWAWPHPPDLCLVAAASEVPLTGRRSVPALRRDETGIPLAVWGALGLLVGGSGRGTARGRRRPGVPYLMAGGASADDIRGSLDVQRLCAAAVAGRAVRTGRVAAA